MRAPPTASLGPTGAPSSATATPVAQRGSEARMTDASVEGSLANTFAVSQIVSDVETSPVYATAAGTPHAGAPPAVAASRCSHGKDHGAAPESTDAAATAATAITTHWSAAMGSSSSGWSAIASSRTTYDRPKPTGWPSAIRSPTQKAAPPPLRAEGSSRHATPATERATASQVARATPAPLRAAISATTTDCRLQMKAAVPGCVPSDSAAACEA
mmetsp:Transcript_4453/g.14429  ORF Transcript_4453/g.14429 Transcript_4453/m.14429 type:complete len:215 (-) Transcript_4453:668-1312(-)